MAARGENDDSPLDFGNHILYAYRYEKWRSDGLDISFRDKKLAKICNSEKELVKAFGRDNARKIMRRLTLLEAAESLSDVPVLPPTRRHELKGDRKGQFAIDVQHPFRIVFQPAHNPIPRKEDGGIDLAGVAAVEIIAIEDYH